MMQTNLFYFFFVLILSSAHSLEREDGQGSLSVGYDGKMHGTSSMMRRDSLATGVQQDDLNVKAFDKHGNKHVQLSESSGQLADVHLVYLGCDARTNANGDHPNSHCGESHPPVKYENCARMTVCPHHDQSESCIDKKAVQCASLCFPQGYPYFAIHDRSACYCIQHFSTGEWSEKFGPEEKNEVACMEQTEATTARRTLMYKIEKGDSSLVEISGKAASDSPLLKVEEADTITQQAGTHKEAKA